MGRHPIGIDLYQAVDDLQLRHRLEQRPVDVLSDGEHHGVRRQLFVLPGRDGRAPLVEGHPLQRQRPVADLRDRAQPLDLDALLERVVQLDLVRRHPFSVAAVDDHCLVRAESSHGTRGVHRGVAAAVHDHRSPERRPVPVGDVGQQAERVQDVRGLHGRDVRPMAERSADGEEGGVEAAVAHHWFEVGEAAVGVQRDPEGEQPGDLDVEHVAG
ncbi:MAG TPA: hypothetical protein VFU35_12120 [Jatrophihabitans sp.]|nr:hypothetical protein [Jatrophihabitans sp.]